MQFIEVNPNSPLDWTGATPEAVKAFGRGIGRAKLIEGGGAVGRARTDSVEAGLADIESLLGAKRRNDAATAGQGLWQPQDLTVRAKEIFAEPETDLIMSHLPAQRMGEVGMNDVELLREFYGGQAIVYAAGNGREARSASVSRSPMRVPLVCLLARVEMSWLDKARDRATMRDTAGSKLIAARRGLLQAANELFLNGDGQLGLPGLLANNPYMPTMLSSVSISGASTADQIVTAIGSQIDNVRVDSRGAYQPDTAILGGRIMDYIGKALRSTGASASILAALKETYAEKYPGFTFRMADALNSRGPAAASEPLVVGRFKGSNPSAALEITMEPTPVASGSDGMLDEIWIAMVIGGVHPRHPGANAVGFYDT